ncbi:hypothetical protein ACVMAJ_001716 [Bradyrhizobium sp. USDA 4448]
MTHPLLNALAQARRRDAPAFVRWCELNNEAPCPAMPSSVARFVDECASLGADRLWSAIQEISRMHTSLGLADPTLGSPVADVMSATAGTLPPRSWPRPFKERFRALPYDIQVYLVAHEARRERALRRAQNETASASRKLAALETQLKDGTTHDRKASARDET